MPLERPNHYGHLDERLKKRAAEIDAEEGRGLVPGAPKEPVKTVYFKKLFVMPGDGPWDDAAFDLAKQMRIAERNRRIAERGRIRSFRVAAFWGVVASIAAIAGGLLATVCLTRFLFP